MAGPHHEHHPLGVEVLEEESGHPLRLGEATDDEVETARPQLLEQDRVLPRNDLAAAARAPRASAPARPPA